VGADKSTSVVVVDDGVEVEVEGVEVEVVGRVVVVRRVVVGPTVSGVVSGVVGGVVAAVVAVVVAGAPVVVVAMTVKTAVSTASVVSLLKHIAVTTWAPATAPWGTVRVPVRASIVSELGV
jgi:hypothetical protein